MNGFAILAGWALILAPLAFYAVTSPAERRRWARVWLGVLALGLLAVSVLDTLDVIGWLLR